MFKRLAQFMSFLFLRKKVRHPEDDFVISLTDESMEVVHPNGIKEAIRWDDIQSIFVITTDEGPVSPDVWFVLVGNEGGCLFPQGAPKSDKAYERISRFDGFDFEAVINAMSSAENARFLLWQRQPDSH